MIYQNLHVITGNLGADANLDVTTNGRRVLHLRVVTEFRTAHKGSTNVTTTWHSVTAWGTLAEKIAHWRKGDLVHIEGPVFEREIKPADGSKPRKVRELYADIAYRIDVGQRADGEETAAPDGPGVKPLVTPTPDDWPV